MVDVITEIIIEAPLKAVFEYSANPDNTPEWYAKIQSINWKTPKPLAVGSQLAFEAEFLGKKLAYIYELIALEPEVKLVMSTAEGPFPMETTYAWEAINDHSTRMTLRNRGIPSGFSKLIAPFMVGAIKKANKKDLKLLKQLLENRDSN